MIMRAGSLFVCRWLKSCVLILICHTKSVQYAYGTDPKLKPLLLSHVENCTTKLKINIPKGKGNKYSLYKSIHGNHYNRTEAGVRRLPVHTFSKPFPTVQSTHRIQILDNHYYTQIASPNDDKVNIKKE